MEKTIIASSNSLSGLERLLFEYFGYSVSIDGKKIKSKDGYSIKQNGNNYVCYKEEEKSNIDLIIEERNRLMVSSQNPKRLEELKAKIDYFEYGIS